jgi:hypothetical protein
MIVSILLLASALSAALGSSAPASPLLSGYGGPGAGNQAILGSTLLNGPRGGGGGGAGGGGAGSAGSSVSAASSSSVGAGTAVSTTGAHAAGTHAGATTHAGHGQRAADGTGRSSVEPASPYPLLERGSAGQSTGVAFGLSGVDLLYVLLVLGALALTAMLTTRLTRTAAAGRHE